MEYEPLADIFLHWVSALRGAFSVRGDVTWMMWDEEANPFSDEIWSTLSPDSRDRLISEGHPKLGPTPCKQRTATLAHPPAADPSNNIWSASAFTYATITANWCIVSDKDTRNWIGVHASPVPAASISRTVPTSESGDCPPFVTSNGFVIHPPPCSLFPVIYNVTTPVFSKPRPCYKVWYSALEKSIVGVTKDSAGFYECSLKVEAARFIPDVGRCEICNLVDPTDTDCFCGLPLTPMDMTTGEYVGDHDADDNEVMRWIGPSRVRMRRRKLKLTM